ncbi:MAG: response regulator transcription factor [Actinomycetota bacterium]|nr:response regulator transcription factor [Actinomycetota bacterium]
MNPRILLVDDHDLIRGGLRGAFEREGFDVVGEASRVEQAVAFAAQLEPDVVVIDVNLPDGSGLDAVRRLRARHPDMGIVVLTMYDDDEHLLAALEAKASAFVPKSSPTDEVLSAARHAAAAPHSFSAANLASAMQRRMDPAKPKLSAREQEVLTLLGEGLTIPLLSKRLYISESTAKTYVSKVYEKLGASNRSQALVEAVRLGLLQVENGGGGLPQRKRA